MATINQSTPPQIEHRIDVAQMEEKQVRSLLLAYHKDGNLVVKKVQENVFSVGGKNGNTEYFCDKSGDVLLNATHLRWNDSFEDLKEESIRLFRGVSWQAGYREETDPKTKTYTLFNIQGIEEKIVPKNTPEFYKAWQDIEFHYRRGQMYVIGEEPPRDEAKRLRVLKAIQFLAKDWYLRIRDLLFLASPKMGYLKQSDFQTLLPVVRNHLLSQIGDPRWDRTLDPARKQSGYAIKKEELDQYLTLNLIDRPLYDQATKKLAEVEKLKGQRQSGSQGVMADTRKKAAEVNR